MSKAHILTGTVHTLPSDMKKAILRSKEALYAWNQITPLARNEWICWVTSVKKEDTRKEHIKRLCAELAAGKRRPCCWIGCIHRPDKPISPSVQYVLSKQKKRTQQKR